MRSSQDFPGDRWGGSVRVCGIRWRFSISCGVVSVGAEGMSTLQRTVRANQAQRLHVRVEDSLLKTVKVALEGCKNMKVQLSIGRSNLIMTKTKQMRNKGQTKGARPSGGVNGLKEH